MTEINRLRWRCRRGVKELDDVLLRYLVECYPGASEAEKREFEGLLALDNAELAVRGQWVMHYFPRAEG